MAIFHCQVKSLSRSSGRSAIAASSYRTGDKLIDNQDGTIHDYTRRSGVVMERLILLSNMDVKAGAAAGGMAFITLKLFFRIANDYAFFFPNTFAGLFFTCTMPSLIL